MLNVCDIKSSHAGVSPDTCLSDHRMQREDMSSVRLSS